MEQATTGTVNIRDFYIRRSLRIWPLYFVFLFGVGLASLLFPSLHITWPRFLSSIFFLANVPVLLHGWNGSPIELLWSVGVEEQFYVIWPNFARIGRTGVILVSSLLIVIPFATLVYFGTHRGSATTQIWPNSLVQCLFFAGGALTAMLPKLEAHMEGSRSGSVSSLVDSLAGGGIGVLSCRSPSKTGRRQPSLRLLARLAGNVSHLHVRRGLQRRALSREALVPWQNFLRTMLSLSGFLLSDFRPLRLPLYAAPSHRVLCGPWTYHSLREPVLQVHRETPFSG